MIFAITYNPDEKDIIQSFHNINFFKIYNIEKNIIIDSSLVRTDGQGHCALAGILRRIGVNAMICKELDEDALISLSELGIRVYSGVEGFCDEAARNFAEDINKFKESTVSI